MTTIGELLTEPSTKRVYRRANGELYIKLNGQFHVKTKLGKDKDDKLMWIGDGSVEQIDPDEHVEMVQ